MTCASHTHHPVLRILLYTHAVTLRDLFIYIFYLKIQEAVKINTNNAARDAGTI